MNRDILLKETIDKIQLLPDFELQEVNDFIDFLLGKTQTHFASENALSKDWLKTEEDEAWKDL